MSTKTSPIISKGEMLPGYFSSCPRMPAVAELRATLGLQSSIVQTIEVALRYFDKNGQASDNGFAAFLKKQATECGLAIGLKDFRVATQSISKWYIVQIFQVVDVFLKNLIDQYRQHKRIDPGNWKSNIAGKNLPRLAQLIENFPKKESSSLDSKPEFHLLEYYRLVRNWVVHPDVETESSAIRLFSKLKAKYSDHFLKCYSSVPNSPLEIGFGDSLLFCRAMICFAYVINDSCRLSNVDIEHIYARRCRHILSNRQHKEARVRHGAADYFKWNYGGDKKLRKEFSAFIAEKFMRGEYFR